MSPSNQRFVESFNSDEHPTISDNIYTSVLPPRTQTSDSEHDFSEMTEMRLPFRSISPPRFRSSDQIAFSYPPSTYKLDPHTRSTLCSNDSFSDMNTYQTPSTGHYSASPYPNRFQSSNDDNVLGQNSSMQHFSRSISPFNCRYSESLSQTPSMCYVSQSPSSSISLYPDTRSVSLFTTYSQPSTSLSPVHWEPPASTPESSSASPEPISPNPYLPPPADATVDIPPPLTENDNHDEQSKTCKNLFHYCSRSISPVRKEANCNTTLHTQPFSLSVPPTLYPHSSANFSDMQSSTSHIDIMKHQTSISPTLANKSFTFSNCYTLTPLTSSDRAVSSLPLVPSTQNRLMDSDTSNIANHHSKRPMSPLRHSTTVQFHSYDDVIATPSLITVERNRSLVNSLGSQQRQKEVSFQNITSITEWLFHMSSDDTLPKLDYNSTQLYSYPDQKSLDCVRQYAHKSIYPRPLFLSRKEDLDLNCKKGRTVEEKAREGNNNHDNSIPVSETCSQTQSTATPLPFENEMIHSDPFMSEMEGESSEDDNDSIDDLVSQLAAIDDNTDETTSQENHVEINNELLTSTSNVCEFNDTLTHTDNDDSEDWTNLRYVDQLATLSKSKDKRENSESERDQKTKRIPHFKITNKFVEGHQYSTAPFPSASACVSLHGLSKEALSSNRFVEFIPSPEELNSSNNSGEICDANSKQQNETVMKVKRQRGRPKKKSVLKRNTCQVKEINCQISNKDNLKVTGEKDVFEYVNSQETLQPRKAKLACTEKLLKVIGKKTKKTKKLG
ncbi:uncharacterized protein MONOS_15152 [Monocercomonoides exilis]|uniref:uncharacterized protein n=1 Tax=Monocercomonoides exilis TaxID=2049356 RepID=UPI0035594C8C|nr:hypothetical protein MONOS_15152 [Monocercomonoides exilis]|eukprot:MONOS_15152.1-p1 / transcript=MONOS_15152.1 / gene=MONOS_15152 / organism=Monocercomonoides_exilis_PA203 / gene_product=unspecified product / transcript_product=unspecified product / location=Mono_scaffold01156:11796-14147(-) / protein_length=784 / sequence_SO=supercontig / SO=protein_coding / is_pseudo=false